MPAPTRSSNASTSAAASRATPNAWKKTVRHVQVDNGEDYPLKGLKYQSAKTSKRPFATARALCPACDIDTPAYMPVSICDSSEQWWRRAENVPSNAVTSHISPKRDQRREAMALKQLTKSDNGPTGVFARQRKTTPEAYRATAHKPTAARRG